MDQIHRYEVTIDIDLCTGCQACQMVCAYHLTGSFSLENSCINILVNNDNGDINTTFDEKKCDMCSNEDLPLCLNFCPPKAISITRKPAVLQE